MDVMKALIQQRLMSIVQFHDGHCPTTKPSIDPIMRGKIGENTNYIPLEPIVAMIGLVNIKGVRVPAQCIEKFTNIYACIHW
jgi:hypothetical protein